MKKAALLILLLALSSSAMFSCGEEEFTPVPNITYGSGKTVKAQDPVTVKTYAEFQALANATPVTVETYVQGKCSWENGACILYTATDEIPEGQPYYMYSVTCTKEEYDALEIGTKIRATGIKSAWTEGEADKVISFEEIADVTFEVVPGSTYVAPVADVTDLIGTDGFTFEAYNNRRISFNATVEAPPTAGTGAAVNDYTFRVKTPKATESVLLELTPSFFETTDSEFLNVVGYGAANSRKERMERNNKVKIDCFVGLNSDGTASLKVYSGYVKADGVNVRILHKTPLVDGKCDIYAQLRQGTSSKSTLYRIDDLALTQEEYDSYQIGTMVTVNGYKNNDNRMLEYIDSTVTLTSDTDVTNLTLPETMNNKIGVNFAEDDTYLNNSDLPGTYRYFSDVQIMSVAYNQGESGKDIHFEVQNADGKSTVYIEAAIVGENSALYQMALNFKKGDFVDVEGIMIADDRTVLSVIDMYKTSFVLAKYIEAAPEGEQPAAYVYAAQKVGSFEVNADGTETNTVTDSYALYKLAYNEEEYNGLYIGDKIIVVADEANIDLTKPIPATLAVPSDKTAYIPEAIDVYNNLVEQNIGELVNSYVTISDMRVDSIEAVLGADGLPVGITKLELTRNVTVGTDDNGEDKTAERTAIAYVLNKLEIPEIIDEGKPTEKKTMVHDQEIFRPMETINVGDVVNLEGFVSVDGADTTIIVSEIIEHVVIDETYVQSKSRDVEGTVQLFTQNGDSAYLVKTTSLSESQFDELAVGAKISVSGVKINGASNNVVGDAVIGVLDSSSNSDYIAEPVDVTELLAANDSDALIHYYNKLVSLKGLSVTRAAQDKNGMLNIQFKIGENNEAKYDFNVDPALVSNDSDTYLTALALSLGEVADVECFLYHDGVNVVPFVRYLETTAEVEITGKYPWNAGQTTLILGRRAYGDIASIYLAPGFECTKEEYDQLNVGTVMNIRANKVKYIEGHSVDYAKVYGIDYEVVSYGNGTNPAGKVANALDITTNVMKTGVSGNFQIQSHSHKLVAIKEMQVATIAKNVNNKNITISFTKGDKNIITTIEYNGINGKESEVYKIADQLKVGVLCDVAGYLGWMGDKSTPVPSIIAVTDIIEYITVDTYVQAKTYENGKATLIAQTENTSYVINDAACSEADFAKLSDGSKIRVTGVKGDVDGIVNINNATFKILKGRKHEPQVAEAADIREIIGTDAINDYHYKRVAVEGWTVSEVVVDDVANVVTVTVTDGNGKTFTGRVDSAYIPVYSDFYTAAKALTVGEVYDIEAVLIVEGDDVNAVIVEPGVEDISEDAEA